MQVLLIDALNLIRRIYAAQERPYIQLSDNISDATKQQIIHNTITAIEQALTKLIRTINPTHGVVVFDGDGPSFRHQLYPDYKKGRSPMPTPLFEGMNDIKAAINKAGLTIVEQPNLEADDLIATLATKVAQNQKQATIVSTDKGFLQLLSPHIRVYDYFARNFLDSQHVSEKFGVGPAQLINYWSLVGDSSNNIPGLAGIGPKSAQDILLQHQSLKEALVSDKLSKKLKEKLQQNLDSFKLCRQLVALKLDIQLGLNLKDIRLN